jgi:hypothetical protein
MDWAKFGNLFGLNRGTNFRHLAEDRWTHRAVGRPSSVLVDEIIALSFLSDGYIFAKETGVLCRR